MNKVLLFILHYLLLISYSHAQTTAIPDANFEQKLIQLGIDSDNMVNGQILNSDAAAVTTLDVSYSNINALTGIAAFVNLEDLNCRNNNLTTLDLSMNTALTALESRFNDLTNLNVSNNTALVSLACGGNDLTALNIANNTALETLNCSYNDLTALSVATNTALKNLNVAGNDLTTLDVSTNVGLESLACTSNNLTALDVSNQSALKILQCALNSLTTLDVSALTNLEVLHCYNNNLSSLTLPSNSTTCKVIYCHDNSLTTLDVSNYSLLETLDCYWNNLLTLNVTNTPVLERLACYKNSISALDLSTSLALKALYCSNNSLTGLDLSNHPLLESVYCSSNNQTNLNLTNTPELKVLDCRFNLLTTLDVSANADLFNVSCDTNNLVTLYLPTNLLSKNMTCRGNLPYLRICVSDAQAAQSNPNFSKDNSAVYSESCYPLSVLGRVVIDGNSNCIADASELGLITQIVRFERLSDQTTFHFSTYDSLGNYRAYLDTGTYQVTVIPNNPYWQACPATQQVTITSAYNIQTLDWTLQPVVNCPYLEVDISAPFLRMTGGGSDYTVSYCNYGTVDAQNAFVEVDLDAALNYVSSTLPIVSQNGTVYTFNVGTVPVGGCGSFEVQVLVDTSAQLAQTHCTEAHIYPDSICIQLPNLPIVDGTVSCQNDTVFFNLENRGATMLQPQSYTVIQDDIAMRVGSIQLTGGQSTTVVQPAVDGSTYRIEVNQISGFPSIIGDSIFSLAIEGCNPYPNGSFNTGYITQFSNGHTSPFIAVDCQQNIAAYDPNDKSAQPEGYSNQHYIYDYTILDYKIRFQNTGNDTAFNIVILDTLSSHLDISTLVMGASSHSYNWEIIGGNVLQVTFPNIMLVDSNANEPMSHGFFRYRIEQVANNPIGTIINNQAAIYFDYNPPIFTNTTFHEVGEDFVPLVLTIDEVLEEEVSVKAFPNPFKQQTTIQVEGKVYESLEIEIYDVMGRLVHTQQEIGTQRLQLERGNLLPGIYVYRLSGDSQLINTGKIIAQ